jgi:flagellar biogenesis protein FliO
LKVPRQLLASAEMRHNSLIVTWAALFLLQAPLAAKPQERKPPAQAPAPAPTPDPRVQEIDKIWMQSLHGQETQPEGNPAQPQSEPGPDDSGTRLLNPGPEEPPAPVQTPAPESRLFPDEERPSFLGTLIRFLLMFALMIGMFYGVTRYLKSKAVVGGSGDLAKTLGTVPLAPGKHLQIVDLAGKILVLGVSNAGVQLVSEITDARTADRIRVWHDSRPSFAAPETLIQKALVALRRTDMRFWKEKRPDFREELGQALGRTAFTPAAVGPAFESPAQGPSEQDLFGSPEDELKQMLRDQKNRLSKAREPLRKRTEEA